MHRSQGEEKYVDFYAELRFLMDQVPGGTKTTTLELARALGDPISETAIRKILSQPNFQKYANKVNGGDQPFAFFQTNKPLLKLANEQEKLAKLVIDKDVFRDWTRVAGVDAAYEGDRIFTACVVVNRSGHIVSKGSAEVESSFPYVPGYFYYREGPALLSAISGLDFDVLIVNAHGMAHPRRLGLASQLGVELDKTVVGVSTRLLVGELSARGGGVYDVFLGDSRVGVMFDGKPHLIVSVGNRVSLETAASIVKTYWNREKLPKPLSLAHEFACEMRRKRVSDLRSAQMIASS